MRYKPEVLAELGRHGLVPNRTTSPETLRSVIHDLYLYEIRKLRDRCRAGEFAPKELPAHVIELRKRYVLLSIPVELWTD